MIFCPVGQRFLEHHKEIKAIIGILRVLLNICCFCFTVYICGKLPIRTVHIINIIMKILGFIFYLVKFCCKPLADTLVN